MSEHPHVKFLTDGVHLIQIGGDTEDLHRFARRLGMRRGWFQDHRIAHYDLLGSFLSKACSNGAVLVSPRVLVAHALFFMGRMDRDAAQTQTDMPIKAGTLPPSKSGAA